MPRHGAKDEFADMLTFAKGELTRAVNGRYGAAFGFTVVLGIQIVTNWWYLVRPEGGGRGGSP